MRSENAAWAALTLLLLAAPLSWWLGVPPQLEVDASKLALFPRELQGRVATDLPMRDSVERMLDADFNLQRAYTRPAERGRALDVIWVYVGYYGSTRGGRPEHLPSECYPSAGWEIEAQRTLDGDAQSPRVTEYRVAQNGERRLVHFWFHSVRGGGLTSLLDTSLDRLRGRVADGRMDGAFVRLSTPLSPGGEARARQKLRGFARELAPEITRRWPNEYRSG